MHYSFDNSTATQATPAQIWGVWSDVNSWHEWDPHTVSAKLEQPFKDGSAGYLEPKDAPAGNMNFTNVVTNKSWTSISTTPLGKLTFIHTITDKGDSRIIAEHMDANGLIAIVFRLFYARKRKESGKETLQALAQRAERATV